MNLPDSSGTYRYRKAHAEGAIDILDFVIDSLRSLRSVTPGMSFDAIYHVEKIRDTHQIILDKLIAENEEHRVRTESAMGIWPCVRTEEEIRKDRLYAEKRYGIV